MFEFWESLIKPIFEIMRPGRVVEIGALRGDNTKNILKILGSEAELHIIDPAPQFQGESLESHQVHFHRDTSLNVLPNIPPFDLGIIDGDHNWYTVYQELKAIKDNHTPESFPLIIFHDVGWPYGRRDMYYNPSTIPETFRQPNAMQGMAINRSELVRFGVNHTLYNATHEGGNRNGVLTAVEEFIATSGTEFIFRTVPAFFGFGYLLSKARAEKEPQSLAALDAIFSSENLLRAMAKHEQMFLSQFARAARQEQLLEHSKRQLAGGAPLTARTTTGIKLSIIVIVFNMQREAKRALTSLTRHYQQGIEDLSYEVIVVDNGSTAPLVKEEVEAYGDYFHYHYLEDASASPAAAVNFGAAQARGEFIGLMIDGAHILTPGVLHYASRAFAQYQNPVVTTHYWYLGPGVQNVTATHGYNSEVEDGLLSAVDWPNDGYALFSIGEKLSKGGSWLEALFESNCLFLSKTLFDAVGGANERFDLPGGGFLNADLYKEAVEFGDAQVVTILGEGSFHQVHGGTTTNVSMDENECLIQVYREQYQAIRGQEYQLPKTHIQYIGHMPREARYPGVAAEHLRSKYNP